MRVVDQRSCLHCGLPVPPDRQAVFCCFGCRIVHGLAAPGEPAAGVPGGGSSSALLLRLGFGIFLALNIMVASWLAYSQEVFGPGARAQGADAILPAVFAYLAMFLCTLLLVLLGFPLLRDAIQRQEAGWASRGPRALGWLAARCNAQTLIVLGVSSAYVLSVLHTVRGEGSLYFDTAAMVLVIVTLGSYLEAGAKRRAASAASGLLAALPGQVRVRRGEEALELEAAEVQVGDRVQVRPGEIVPVDGRVVEGASRLDEASLTGESRPRSVEVGDRVLAGTVSLDGQLWLCAENVGDATVLALTERTLAEARAGRPEIQRQADRVAQAFVPGVVLLALAVFAWHAGQGYAGRGDVETGLLRGLAVLLISCPCALGLAAPLACWHGLRRAAERGVLIDSAATLERAALVDHLSFDKTGTLTRPELTLEGVATAGGIDSRSALAWAAALESASTHPIAHAVLAEASRMGVEVPEAHEVRIEPGMGVSGRAVGRTLHLGSARWADRLGLASDPLVQPSADVGSSLLLLDDERVLARFDLVEALRPSVAETLSELQSLGVRVNVLSGDRAEPTRRLGKELGVPAEGELLPEDKVERLRAVRSVGCLAMVGDGINDAPVLAAADVGIALGSASELARRSGHVRLLCDRLDRIPWLLSLAKDTRRRIRANLLWAFCFNTVGMGLAVFGWLTPVLAAVAMVLSSLTVVWISSRPGASAGASEGATRFGESSPRGAPRGATRFGEPYSRGTYRGASRFGEPAAVGGASRFGSVATEGEQ